MLIKCEGRLGTLIRSPFVPTAKLSEKRVEPSLIDLDKGVRLVIPTMGKIGQLRQSAAPEAGKSYWMAFSNKGRIVKRGDRVNIVIGNFHAESLRVE